MNIEYTDWYLKYEISAGISEVPEKWGGQNPKVGGQKPYFGRNLFIIDWFSFIFGKSGVAIDSPAPLLPKALKCKSISM